MAEFQPYMRWLSEKKIILKSPSIGVLRFRELAYAQRVFADDVCWIARHVCAERIVTNNALRLSRLAQPCVYQKPNLGRSGDEVRLAWQVT
jgi:hypothetical protein